MMIFRVLSGIGAVALGAAAVLSLPGFSPEVEARTPAPSVKADRLDVPATRDCTRQGWPYYDAACIVDRSQPTGQARVIRVISTDRVAAR